SGGTVTVHGELESVSGSNTIQNVTGSKFTNDGSIEIIAGALILLNDFLNNSGVITVDSGGTLKLNDGTTIFGGTMILAGALEVDSGAANEISDIAVTDVGDTSEIVVAGGTLTLDHASFNGKLITIIVEPGATLNVAHSFITDASIENLGGTINVTADSTIQTVQSGLSGHNTVQSGATLTLIDELVTGTIDDQGTILVKNNVIFDGVIVDDDTTTLSPPGIDITSGATLTLKNNTH